MQVPEIIDVKEKFINPFTDYGFKKIFGSEPNFDDEKQKYFNSLKHYLDLKNSFDTARVEGIAEGEKKREIEIAIKFIQKGYTNDIIKDGTDLLDDEIEKLRSKLIVNQKKLGIVH